MPLDEDQGLRGSARTDLRLVGVRFLRQSAIHHQTPSLRPHPRQHHQGHRHPPLRLGLPWFACRERDGLPAQYQETRRHFEASASAKFCSALPYHGTPITDSVKAE